MEYSSWNDINDHMKSPCCRSYGFTLIELLVVIAILGILAAIAVPTFLGQRTKAAQAEATTNLNALRLILEQNFAENSCYYVEAGACTNKTLGDIKAITDYLKGFRPEKGTDPSDPYKHLGFDYRIEIKGTAPATATEFQIIATGKSGKNVEGSKFCVNQNNDRTCP